MAVFLNLLHRWESAELNQEEAAELPGIDVRTFRRWARRYEEEGEAGLLDRRLGKASGKRVPSDRGRRWRRSTASATRASPSSTSTSIW
jgi:transposase